MKSKLCEYGIIVIQNDGNSWKHLISHKTYRTNILFDPLSTMLFPCRYQSVYLHYKSNDWFLYEGTLVINDWNAERNFVYLSSEKQPWKNSFQSQQ